MNCSPMDDIPRVQYSWKRPSTIAFPNIWNTFETTSKDGKICRFRIQDITEDRFDEVIRFMETYFDTHEPVYSFVKILEDEESATAKRYVRKKILEQRVSIMVTPDEEDAHSALIACYILFVDSKIDQPSIKGKGKAYDKCANLLRAGQGNVDPFQFFNSDRYLNEFGVCVSPAYRRMGIAYQIFSALPNIAKAFQLPGMAGVFSSDYSQKIARNLGFHVLHELAFEDYKDEDGRIVFEIENPKSLLFFAVKYN